MPLRFEVNEGQTDAQVRFISRGQGYTFYLTPAEAVFALTKSDNKESRRQADRALLRMRLVGAKKNPAITGAEELTTKTNYFIGNDPAKWRTNVASYGRVRYENVYTGVDMVYYGNQRQLEYDFIVAPGADARQIALEYSGAQSLTVNQQGDLVISVEGGEVVQHKPIVYQEVDGGKQLIAAAYNLTGERVGFQLGEYDESRPLVIDPVLVYSTYLGGSDTEIGTDIAIDSAGNAIVTGFTLSLDFPLVNAFDGKTNGTDAYITKLNAAGNAIIFSTYLGGNGNDQGNSLTLDGANNIYIAGLTTSTDYPTALPIQANNAGGQDAVVTKFNATGSALIYSTYLGGSVTESANAIAIDAAGNAYVSGFTSSPGFPTTAVSFQPTIGGTQDAFVLSINNTGTALTYSSFLGGASNENSFGIDVDAGGNAYVVGFTQSTNFPTVSAFQNTLGGARDGFVTKVNGTGSALVYSTYLGGASGTEDCFDVDVDSAGNAYVVGRTQSTNFPILNAFQPVFGGVTDGFVTKFMANGSALVFSTYLGGSDVDGVAGVELGTGNEIFLAGQTASTNFPTANPIQAVLGGGLDIFVARMSASGSSLLFSTYLGGNMRDDVNGLRVETGGNAYITGFSGSTNFPTLNAVQPMKAGSSTTSDSIIAKIDTNVNMPPPPNPLTVSPGTLTFNNTLVNSTSTPQSVMVTNTGTNVVQLAFTAPSDYIVDAGNCGTLAPGENCTASLTFAPKTAGDKSGVLIVTDKISGNTANVALQAMSGASPGQIQFSTAVFSTVEGSVAVITVIRTGDFNGEVSVDFLTNNGTASAGVDYNEANATVTFASGDNSPKNIFITTLDNNIPDGDRTVNMTLTNPTNGANLGLSSAQLVISNNDQPQPGRFLFQNPNVSANEDSGGVTLTVVRQGGDNVPVSVNVITSNQSATSGSDYAQVSATLNFPTGVSQQSISIPILDDSSVEGDEQFQVTISNATNGGIIGGNAQATVTIVDNDRSLPPLIDSDQMNVDFGSVNIGQMVMRAITVRNRGGEPLIFSSAVVLGGGGFSLSAPPQQNIAPGASTTLNLIFRPSALGNVSATLALTSNGGNLNIPLRAVAIDNIPPTVRIMFNQPQVMAGSTVVIPFTASDNDRIDTIIVTYIVNGTVNGQGEIGRFGGFVAQIRWNLPALLEGSARISIEARDRSGNITNQSSNNFVIVMPSNPAPVLQNTVSWMPPNRGGVSPPTNAQVQSMEVRTAADLPNIPLLQVNISFDAPPRGQIAPPQNVRVVASEITPQGAARINRRARNSAQEGPNDLAGFNIYRVPAPPEGQPLPTADQIVGNPNNLIATLDADTTNFMDIVPTSADNSNFVYSITSFFGGGMMSMGSMPSSTDLPMIKNPRFDKGGLILDAAGSFIKAGATLMIDERESYPLQFDSSGALLSVGKKVRSSPGNMTLRRLIKVGATVRLTVKNPDGKVSVGVMFMRNGKTAVTNGAIRPQEDDGPQLLGYNIFRVPAPESGSMPTPDEIVQPENLVGSVPADTTTFVDTVSTAQSGNFVYSITSFFGGGMQSMGSNTANTDLPVIKKPTFMDGTLFFDAQGSNIKNGAQLVIQDTESLPLTVDASGARFMVVRNAMSMPGNQVIANLVRRGIPVRLVIRNPDGKLSVGVVFTRK